MTTNIEESAKIAQKRERERCLQIVLEEYKRWREVKDDSIIDFATGAMGASANIMARILELTLMQ